MRLGDYATRHSVNLTVENYFIIIITLSYTLALQGKYDIMNIIYRLLFPEIETLFSMNRIRASSLLLLLERNYILSVKSRN